MLRSKSRRRRATRGKTRSSEEAVEGYLKLIEAPLPRVKTPSMSMSSSEQRAASDTSLAPPTTLTLAMDSPDSVSGPSTSARPSPLSPQKRRGSAPPPDNPAVAQASKRLRSVLLDGADEAGEGKGKGKQEDKADGKDSLLADLEAQVTCG